jgi:hypothetical protein
MISARTGRPVVLIGVGHLVAEIDQLGELAEV